MMYTINACFAAGMVPTRDPVDIMKQIVCDMKSKECTYRECQICATKKFTVEDLDKD